MEKIPLYACCWKSEVGEDGSSGRLVPRAQITPAEEEEMSRDPEKPEADQVVALEIESCAVKPDEVKLDEMTETEGPE